MTMVPAARSRYIGGMHEPAELDHLDVWIFDLDNTLYPARCNLFAQIDQRMGEFIADLLDLDFTAARHLQKSHYRQHGTTLRGLMIEHGIDPHGFLDYVHDIDYSPVPASPDLDAALERLPGRKFVFTNGTVAHAERTMEQLGIGGHFEAIFDIVASDFVPKPNAEPYRAFIDRHDIRPEGAAFFEDIAKNLLAPHALGMTTVWVPGGGDWAADGADGAHVHHVVEDLAGWLAAAKVRAPQTPS